VKLLDWLPALTGADRQTGTLLATKGLLPQSPLQPLSSRGGWWSVVREPFTGAWQTNQDIRLDNVLTNAVVYACIRQISGDIAKLCLNLTIEEDGIWTKTDSPAFSPVLRKPNHYQTIIKFKEQWLTSKLIHGNTFVLKQRDNRGIVTQLYILDPLRVVPLVAQDGSVYYKLERDDLSQLPKETVYVPASEIIHDIHCALFHPLVGVSPLYACAQAALQGLAIQTGSTSLFQNGGYPGGVLSSPERISDETAARLKAYWDTNYSGTNAGKVAVLGDGLKFEKTSLTAVDSQLIDQLKWTGETICTAFGVPPYLVGVGPAPPYANIEPVLQQYYNLCLQIHIASFESVLDEGLGLGAQFGNDYGTELDIDDLIWMNTEARSAAAKDGIGSGGMSPNEARKRYFGLGGMAGGETPYLQEQNWPLRLLAARTLPMRAPTAPAEPQQPVDPAMADPDMDESKAAALLRTKAIELGLLAA
jgi:HK97 family phage portal protein